MNANNKKLFLIFPKESESEQNLFKAFYSTISKQTKDDTLIKFLLKNSAAAREYQEQFDDDNIDTETLKQEIIELIKTEKDLVIECHIKLNNTEFFSTIKNNYKMDTEGICQKLKEILSSLESVLRKFEIVENLSDFSKIIMVVHPGGESTITYLDMQHTINNFLPKTADLEKVKFVYFSSLDEPGYNKYIHNHRKFSAFSYEKLIKEKSDGQFNYFLELLEARAEGEEIKYFESVITKKYINDLIKIFLPTAIDCNGIQQLSARNLDTGRYEEKAFGGLPLNKYLERTWGEKNGESTLFNLGEISDKKANDLRPIMYALRNAAGSGDFTCKFKEFTDAVASIKKSPIFPDNKT